MIHSSPNTLNTSEMSNMATSEIEMRTTSLIPQRFPRSIKVSLEDAIRERGLTSMCHQCVSKGFDFQSNLQIHDNDDKPVYGLLETWRQSQHGTASQYPNTTIDPNHYQRLGREFCKLDHPGGACRPFRLDATSTR